MSYHVESIFYHNSLKCCVIFSSLGHRCGYVGVDKTHPLFKIDYLDPTLTLTARGEITYSSDNSRYPILQIKPLWWFGFDCAHCGDAKDWPTLKKTFPIADWKTLWEIDIMYPLCMEGIIRTKKYVKQECRKLVNQINQYA